jgi:cell division protein FtsZ
MAISSPLLEASIDGAHGVLLSVSGGSDLGLFEINEAANLVAQAAHEEANIIFGAVIDDALGDEVRVTVIAAGFDGGTPKRRELGSLRRSITIPSADTADGPPAHTDDGARPAGAASELDGAEMPPREDAMVTTPTLSREPRRMVPPSDDDLDVPDFLK